MVQDSSLVTNQYNSVAKFLHWSIGILIILNYIGGLTLDATGHRFMNLHKQAGMLILLLVILRIFWRMVSKYPDSAGELSAFENFAAKSGQFILYILMLAIPVLGILLVESHGYNLKFFGIIDIPTVISPQTRSVSHQIKEIHEYLAHAIIVLAVIHALFALKHHFINKDRVLKRMMPRHKKLD